MTDAPDDRSYFAASAFEEPSAEERSKGASVKASQPSQAAELIEMARSRYGVVRSTEGKVYAVEHERPGIALDLRGKAGLRQSIAKAYFDGKGRAASQAALTDMLNVLEGDAMAAADVPVHLRFGQQGRSVYVDMGTPDGSAIEVTPAGWRVLRSSPVLFRRSELISALPVPAAVGGSLDGLRGLLNISDDGFRLLVGWLVAAFLESVPRPILALFGQQGTAKTTAMRMLKQTVDPSAAPTMTPPRSDEDWAVNAYHSPVIALDNVSHLAPWFQDALCKAVTGDGVVRRERYSDDAVSVLSFRRAIAMTSIDPGSLQGDVADRLLTVELEPISPSERRTDREVSEEFDAVRASVLGALLDLLARVLHRLPEVKLKEMPRMADFARVLAAVDAVQGWDTLPTYLAAAQETAQTVVEGDAFATALRDLVEARRSWTGTMAGLLELVTPEHTPRGWPKVPHRASGLIKRMTPALREIGITVAHSREAGTGGRRLVTLSKAELPLVPATEQGRPP